MMVENDPFLSFFKSSKNCVHAVHIHLCAICSVMIGAFLLIHIYEQWQIFHHFGNQQYLGVSSKLRHIHARTRGYKDEDPSVEFHKLYHSKQSQRNADPGINATHINGTIMERVNAEDIENIYFTVKTTYQYYTDRLFPLMLTWLQAVDKSKVSIITDRSETKQVYVDLIRRAGFHIIDTDCLPYHTDAALSCKTANEFAAYYKAIEENPDKEDNYQWFCHCDDDMYINIPRLSQFLVQHDPRKPYYIGKWPGSRRGGFMNVQVENETIYNFTQKLNYTLKTLTYQYATGAVYCISYTLMMEAKEFFNGMKAFKAISAEILLPDDMTIGFIIGILLGYNLTDTSDMMNEYDFHINKSSLNELIKYITVSSSIITNNSLKKLNFALKGPLFLDSTKFTLYHCLIYTTVSWCQSVKELLNHLDANDQ